MLYGVYQRTARRGLHAGRALSALVTVMAVALVAACSDRHDPIVLEEGVLIVENQTKGDWHNVIVTVNDHFRGGVPALAAGSRMTAPLTQFQTAFGQKYDRARMSVVKVELTATDSAGKPVTLAWNGTRKPR